MTLQRILTLGFIFILTQLGSKSGWALDCAPSKKVRLKIIVDKIYPVTLRGAKAPGCWIEASAAEKQNQGGTTQVHGYSPQEILCQSNATPQLISVDSFRECCDGADLTACTVQWTAPSEATSKESAATSTTVTGDGSVLQFGGDDNRAVSEFANSVATGDPYIAHHAGLRLLDFGAAARPATEILRTALLNEHPYVRGISAVALLRLSKPKEKEVPHLLVVSLENLDSGIASESSKELKKYSQFAPQVMPELILLLTKMPYHEEQVMTAIESMGPASQKTIDQLIDAMMSTEKFNLPGMESLRKRLTKTICTVGAKRARQKKLKHGKVVLDCAKVT